MTSVIPLSEMGRCTGHFRLGERRPIIAMRCYFDGSEGKDDRGAKWLTLAGYMASDSFWGDFDDKWKAMIRNRYPIAPYIHMNPLVMREDPFERVAGWTDEKMTELVTDALKFLGVINKRAYCSFVMSIDVTAHERLLAEGLDIPQEPVVFLTHVCIHQAFLWYAEEHPESLERAYVFFDQNEPFIYRFREAWLKHTMKTIATPFWGLIANVQPVDMRNTPAIQAADMLAWGRTRSLSQKDRPYRYLDELMKKIIPQGSIRISEQRMREMTSANYIDDD
jgi:hypothetical protein